jgi:hypothetical protein
MNIQTGFTGFFRIKSNTKNPVEIGKLHRKRKVDNSFRQKGKCGKGK